MGYDLLAGLFFVLMTPLVLVGFVLFWVVNARDHDELTACWRGYARQRGLEFVEPAGEWPNRSAPAIQWKEGGNELHLTAVGREARVRTRLTIRPTSALLGTLACAIDEGGQAVAVRERPTGFARRILTDRVHRVLLGFRQRERVVLRYKRGRVVVEWPGGERNDARLDEARRAAEQIARAIDDEFRASATRGAERTSAANAS